MRTKAIGGEDLALLLAQKQRQDEHLREQEALVILNDKLRVLRDEQQVLEDQQRDLLNYYALRKRMMCCQGVLRKVRLAAPHGS